LLYNLPFSSLPHLSQALVNHYSTFIRTFLMPIYERECVSISPNIFGLVYDRCVKITVEQLWQKHPSKYGRIKHNK
jgi:hypothetical protein